MTSQGPERGGLYLGIDLGNTKTAISLWRASTRADDFERLARAEWPTPAGGPDATLARVRSELEALLGGEGTGRRACDLAAIGVSGGGPVDAATGVLRSMAKQPGWNGCPLAERLREELGVPARVENDANACAVAEWLYGAGRGARNLAFLTCSTGLGAGLVLDGRLYRGGGGIAGEVGLTVVETPGAAWGSGVRGCLEAYASGEGMARRLRERETVRRGQRDDAPASARDVVERARAGDASSIAFLAETARYLARGIAPMLVLLDLDRVVFGTIVAHAGALLLEPLREALRPLLWKEHLDRVELVPSGLWPDVGDYAAFCVARDFPRILSEPPPDPSAAVARGKDA